MNRCWCGNESFVPYSKEYHKCTCCKTLISDRDFNFNLTQIEDEENDLYGKEYWQTVMVKEAGVDSIDTLIDMYLAERVPYWFSTIMKYIPFDGRVAEVGCGLGQLSYLLNRSGIDQIATELSPVICDYIHQELGVEIVAGELCKCGEDLASVVAIDVFEHLLDPDGFVAQCEKQMREDGVLVLQTPCYDPELDYEQMLAQKPRFQHLLVPDQHIYLFSRESVTKILKDHGFEYVEFVPAFFGDDYDMFLFASRKPLKEHTKEEMDAFLNKQSDGRMVKAILAMSAEKEALKKKYYAADQDRIARGKQVEELTTLVKGNEQTVEAEASQVEELTKLLKESEADRDARLVLIEELGAKLEESDADRNARGEQITELGAKLQEIDADRIARGEQVEKLTKLLQESEADRAARGEQIEALTKLLQESEADRAARGEQITLLTRMVKDTQEESAARFEQIETLSAMIRQWQGQEEEVEDRS